MGYGLVFGVLVMVLILFVWGKIRHDFVALLALFVLIILNVIDPADAFIGFVNPAVITVAAVLVIGKGLEFSGLIDLMGKWVMKIGKKPFTQILSLSLFTALASAFMNNVGALAIMMPIAIHLARKTNYPVSYILMPIAFASLLGGMTTLIGTPPNIIIATFRATATGRSFSMFDFFSVGAGIALIGILFISLIGWRLLPKRSNASGSMLFEIDDYITEVELTKDSKIVNTSIQDLQLHTKADIQILGIIRNKTHIHAPDQDEILKAKDILILETDTEILKTFIADTNVVLVGNKKTQEDEKLTKNLSVVEAVVMADSLLIKKTSTAMRLRSRYGINLLAVARKGQKIQRRLDQVIFQTGDVLLLQGRADTLNETIISIGCLPLAQRDVRLGYKTKIPLALGIFISSILIVVTGIYPVEVAFPMAALAMILTGILPVKDVYTSVDWPVIILLGAMIPIGTALETSGGAALIASFVLHFGQGYPPWVILATILIVTMFLSDIINNAATVVLMAPIAIGVAKGLNFSIDPFLIAVALGASCAFLTPIGHQSNTLVMGPGGYKFTDYWRMGLPLEIIIVVIGVPLIMRFWPL